MSKKLLNEKGFSLAEVMVAAGISGVVALGSMKIAENSQKTMRNLSTNSSLTNYVHFKAGSYLSDNAQCISAWDLASDGDTNPKDDIVLANIDDSVAIQRIEPELDPVTLTTKVLFEVGQNIQETGGEFRVSSMNLVRNSDSSCTLQLSFSRNDAADGARKVGGRDKRIDLNLGCSFDGANKMATCSSKGTTDLAKWTHNQEGAVEWLHNSTGNAVLGIYDNTITPAPADPWDYPPASLTIMNSGMAWNTDHNEAISLPNNASIKWGDVAGRNSGIALSGRFNGTSGANAGTGTFVFGDSQNTPNASQLVTISESGTSILQGNLAASNDAQIGGSMAVAGAMSGGSLTTPSALNVSNGLNVTGQTRTDTLVTTGNATVGGTLSASGATTLGSTLSVNGMTSVTGEIQATDTIRSNNGIYAGGMLEADNGLRVSAGGSILINSNAGGTEIRNNLITSGASATINSNIYQSSGSTAYLQTVYANSYLYYSDRRLKEDIQAISEGDLAALMELRPVSYYWKNKNVGAQREMGLIAQEVEKVFPDLVRDAKGGIKTVNYGGLISPLIGAVQELKAENDKLKKENEEIKARLDRIERALANQR